FIQRVRILCSLKQPSQRLRSTLKFVGFSTCRKLNQSKRQSLLRLAAKKNLQRFRRTVASEDSRGILCDFAPGCPASCCAATVLQRQTHHDLNSEYLQVAHW